MDSVARQGSKICRPGRQHAPEFVQQAHKLTSRDAVACGLPLNDLISGLPPATLRRRTEQRLDGSVDGVDRPFLFPRARAFSVSLWWESVPTLVEFFRRRIFMGCCMADARQLLEAMPGQVAVATSVAISRVMILDRACPH